MENLKLRYLIIAILLALTAAVVNGLQYDSSHDDQAGLTDLQAIPMQIGGWWQGRDFPLDEMVYDILETKAIIHRTYTGKDDKNIFLSVVHYSDTKVDFHAPEACLGGQGFLTEKTNTTVIFPKNSQESDLNVAQIITTKETGKTLSYYFYKSGNFMGSNYIKMRLNVAANKLLRNNAKGSLIRISTNIVAGNESEARVRLVDFLENLLPYVRGSL